MKRQAKRSDAETGKLLDFTAAAATPEPVPTPEETIARIEAYLDNPPEESKVFVISHLSAAAVLARYNAGNRNKKPAKIRKMVADHNAGHWENTKEPCKFSEGRFLVDGQNRLHACADAGATIKLHFVFGVRESAKLKMDIGTPRSGGDMLQIAGYKDPNNLASAVRWAHLLSTGTVKDGAPIPSDRVKTLLEDLYPSLPEILLTAGRINSLTKQPKGLVAALLLMFGRANKAKAATFAEGWQAGERGGVFTGLSHLTYKVTEIISARGSIKDVERAAFIVMAWNLFIQGKKGTRKDFAWTVEQDFPTIEG